jgi:hypothetical protein
VDAAAYSLIGVGLGGGMGFVGQWWLAHRSEGAARTARLSEHRRPVYDRLVKACRRQLTLIEHAHPIAERVPAPLPPDDITQDAAIEVQAQADAWSSARVADAHAAFTKAIRGFESVVSTERAVEYHRSRKADSIGPGEPYIRVETARETVRLRYADLVTIVRNEMESIA